MGGPGAVFTHSLSLMRLHALPRLRVSWHVYRALVCALLCHVLHAGQAVSGDERPCACSPHMAVCRVSSKLIPR